jgi:hypothetical protein
MSLNRLEETHWTAQAFFVVSLTTGALSVFFSCVANPAFHGLHSAENIKDFLTKPTPSAQRDRFRRDVVIIESIVDRMQHSINVEKLRTVVESDNWQVASPYAALMLVAPMLLLQVALNAFLVGLGIYLGELVTARLIISYGSGSVGILVFYLVSTLFGLALFYVAQGVKSLDDVWLKRWRNILVDFKIHQERTERDSKRDTKPTSKVSRFDSPPVHSSSHQPTTVEAQDSVQAKQQGHIEQQPFRQSAHLRVGDRVHYTIDSIDEVQPAGQLAATLASSTNGRYENNIHSFEGEGLESDDTADPSVFDSKARTRHLPPHNNTYRTLLQTLIKAQEEALEVTKQLLILQETQAVHHL